MSRAPLGAPRSGHRVVPHTADLLLEAWGSSREACLAEAVRALAATFVDARRAPTTEVPFTIGPDTDDELLVRLLDEVVYLVDARGVVPVDAAVEPVEGGVISGTFAVADVGDVEVVGVPPKAIAHHAVVLEQRGDHWFARVTVDV